METGRLLLALALTWLPGSVWMMRLLPGGVNGRACLVAGYGLLSGLVMVPLLMRFLSVLGVQFSFFSIGLAAFLLLLAGLLAPRKWQVAGTGEMAAPASWKSLGKWEMLIIGVCGALIAARLIALGMEAGLRPIFAWDGKQHWAKQAKFFFETGSVAQYVPFRDWLELGGSGVFTTVHPDYPITIPLLQVWANLAIGAWHDSLMNLPWVLCYLALGLIFFGQLRAAGARTAVAIAATYMLLSLPYLNIQVALAGYADIFMATCYLAAVTAFFNWTGNQDRGQAILAVFFAFSCLLIKNEGLFWLLSFAPGLLLVWLGLKRSMMLLLPGFMLLVLCLWLLPNDFTIAGQSLANINLKYRPSSWPPIYKSFFEHDNWHLLSYAVVALMLAAATLAKGATRRVAPLAAVVLSALVLFMVLYLFTRHAYGARVFTSINRVALQLIPAMGFFATVLFLCLNRGKTTPIAVSD